MRHTTLLPLMLVAMMTGGCAGSSFWGWWYEEPQVYVKPVPSNVSLFRECVQQLPLERCQQLAHQWAQQDQLNRIEQQNALVLGNQQYQLLNQYLEQQRRMY